MHRTLVDFIKVLRNAEIQVSPAETLDAMHVLELIGTRNRKLKKHSPVSYTHLTLPTSDLV